MSNMSDRREVKILLKIQALPHMLHLSFLPLIPTPHF